MITWLAAAGVTVLLLVPLTSPVLETVNVAAPAVVRLRPVNVATPLTTATVVTPLAKLANLPPTVALIVALAVLLVTVLPY